MRPSGTGRRPFVLALLLRAGSPCLGTNGFAPSSLSGDPLADAEAGWTGVAIEPECVWPNCTAFCEDCHMVPWSTCVVPKMFGTPCGDNAYCDNKLCFCEKGFCHHNKQCVPRDCKKGARPEPFEASAWARAFASMGPDMPHTVETQEWIDFVYSTLMLPVVLVAVGFVIAMSTCAYIILTEDHSACSFLPTSPWLLLGMAVSMFIIVTFGIVARHIAMVRTFDVGHEQLDRLDHDMAIVRVHALDLNATSAQFSTSFHMIPTSCNMVVVEYGAEKLVSMGDKYVNMITSAAADISNMVTELELKIDHAKHFSALLEQLLLITPLLPLVFMFVVIAAIIAVTLISWCHHDPDMADKADDAVFRYGGCCIGGLIVTTAFVGGFFLWAGISEGALCVDVDVNIMMIINDMNFTAMANMSKNIDNMIDKTFEHYLMGNESNPLVSKINLVDRLLEGLYNMWNKTHQVVNVAQQMCPAFNDLDMDGVFRKVEAALHSIRAIVNAQNIWPYYEAIMHTLLCGTLTESTGFLVIINVIIGLIAFPILAVLAHVDLDRWSQWKSSNNRGRRRDKAVLHNPEQSDPLLVQMQSVSREPSVQSQPGAPGATWQQMQASQQRQLQPVTSPQQPLPETVAHWQQHHPAGFPQQQPSHAAMAPWQHHPAGYQTIGFHQQPPSAAMGPWQSPTAPRRSIHDQRMLPPGALWSSAVVGHSPVVSPSMTASGSPATSTSARTSDAMSRQFLAVAGHNPRH